MWVPKSLLRLVALTATDDDDTASDPTTSHEDTGRIRSDDFVWADRSPAPLRSLCLDVISGDFALYHPPHRLIDAITPANVAYLAETLDTGLPITAVVHVPCDEYWRRRFVDRPPDDRCSWPDPTDSIWFSPLGSSGPDRAAVRSTYLTRLAGAAVEDHDPRRPTGELDALLDACGPHVDALVCRGLRAREPSDADDDDAALYADLGPVLRRLRHVRRVRLAYGRRFGARDADALGRGLAAAPPPPLLSALAVTGTGGLDARAFDALSPHLGRCAALVRVDLSGCRLRCAGAASVARWCAAGAAAALARLDLADNDVGADGAGALADAAVRRRGRGHPAVELNLNMNRINDVGAKYLASALASGLEPFTKLEIRVCNISEIGGMDIVQSLANDRGLRALEIDNNKLSLKVAIALHEIMKTNTNITHLSTLNCDFPENISNFLRNVAFHNRYNKRSQLTYKDFDDLYIKLDEENISLEEKIVKPVTEIEDSR